MGVKIRQKGNKLYLDTYWQGRRTWKALKLTLGNNAELNKEALRLAEIIRQKQELQLVSGEHGIIDSVGARRTVVEYARELAEGHGTGDHLHRVIKYLEDYGKGIQLQAVNIRWVEGFQKYLLSQNISKRTASHMYKALGRILTRAVQDLLILKNPAENLRGISVPETIPDYLTAEDLETLAGTSLRGDLGAEIKKAFFFACLTGLRIGDIRSLTWGEIRRETLQILKRQHKTGRIVTIPLNQTAWDLIKTEEIPRHDTPVFPLVSTTGADTNKYLREWTERAGIGKRVGWHTARRTFGTLILESGADFSTVSRLLGHSGIQITARYAQSTDTAKRKAVEGLPEIKMGERA